MTGVDSEIMRVLAAIGLLVVGAGLKHLFDRLAAQRGWDREDKRAQDGKIERVDSQARESIARVERELGAKLHEQGTAIARLDEKVAGLPTSDDMDALNRRLTDLDRGLSGVLSKAEGINGTVKTILDHILAGERGR